MRQNDVRTTKHSHTPSSKAGQPSRHRCNQMEGPAYKLGQGATRDQPRGEGKQHLAGRGADNSQKTRQTQRGPTIHRKERNTDREAPTNTQAETPDRQHHEPRKAKPERDRKVKRTKDGRESMIQVKAAPEKQTCK